MAYNELTLQYSKLKILEGKIKKIPKQTEYEVNNYLWTDAGKVLENEVYRRMPRSKYKKYGIPKDHAKDTESLEQIRYNLGIKVQTKLEPRSKDFGYLIFPDEGRGIKQTATGKQEFFGKSLESKTNQITNKLIDHINKKIKERLNNDN